MAKRPLKPNELMSNLAQLASNYNGATNLLQSELTITNDAISIIRSFQNAITRNERISKKLISKMENVRDRADSKGLRKIRRNMIFLLKQIKTYNRDLQKRIKKMQEAAA